MRKVIEEAFSLWANVTNLKFTRVETGIAHIDIKFITGEPFDGPKNLLGIADFPHVAGGEIRFDDDELWTVGHPGPGDGMELLTVATHEIGHSLGLDHSSKKSALMAPGPQNLAVPELDVDDVAAIQFLYGEPGEERPHYENMEDVELIGMTDLPVLVTNIRDYIDKLQKVEMDFMKYATIIDKYDLEISVNLTSKSQTANDTRRPLERIVKAIERRGGESINRSFHRKIIQDLYLLRDMKALKTMEELSQATETLIRQKLLLAELNDMMRNFSRPL